MEKREKTSTAKETSWKNQEFFFLLPGLLFLMGIGALYLSWGKSMVFDTHDQLDETILSYVLPARHLFEAKSVYSEMMCDLPGESLRASAPVFIPLYRLFRVEWAFVIQFLAETFLAYLGAYLLIGKVTGSPFAAMVTGLLFSFLPFQPVYGLNIIGVPLFLYLFVSLYEKEEFRIAWLLPYAALLALYVFTTHIALAGYTACAGVLLGMLFSVIRDRGFKKKRLSFYLGGILLFVLYGISNADILYSLVIGGGGLVCHRPGVLANASGNSFLRDFVTIFLYGEDHYAPSLHRFFLPVAGVLTVYVILRMKKTEEKLKKAGRLSLVLWGAIVCICLLYAFFNSGFWADICNRSNGFIRYTNLSRFYYFLPGLWWSQLGILGGFFIKDHVRLPAWVRGILYAAALLPTVFLMKKRICLYDNINYRNHGSAYTGKPSLEEYYHSDVFAEIDGYIGREKASYRIAHIGLSPAPSLVYGFYTVDGYSNNYPMEYKKKFRRVIAPVLEENPVLADYYDRWGSRVYLFADESFITDEGYGCLPFDLDALSGLGCAYILSDRKIIGDERLSFEKDFVAEQTGDVIYLYRLVGENGRSG